jgi:hypothetical protein
MKKICTFVLFLVLGSTPLPAAETLDIYVFNVDLGNAVLVVTPADQGMLLDAGPPGEKYLNRILRGMKDAELKQIDYLVISHYHWDHYGTVAELAEKVPIRHYIDHGPSIEKTNALYELYVKTRDKGDHLAAKPGDKIPLQGVEVQVLTSAGQVIAAPVKGGGGFNSACWLSHLRVENEVEDVQSVGVLVEFGKFRFVDLGDVPWNLSCRLFCPENKVGPADVYLITHHAISRGREECGDALWGACSCPPCEVYGLRPRVAILSTNEDYVTRLATPEAWQTIRLSPGLEDIWQTHYQAQGGPANNAPEQFIACPNVVHDEGDWIKVSAHADGSFSVTNQRNGFTKQYPARK